MKNPKKGKGQSWLKFDGRIADPFKFEPIDDLDLISNKTYVLAELRGEGI